MSIWNVAHNVGGALIGPMAAVGMAWFGSWQAGTFWFPAIVALVIVVIAYLLIRVPISLVVCHLSNNTETTIRPTIVPSRKWN